MEQERMVCVYTHQRPDTDTVFYVGMGVKSRPFSKCRHNSRWHEIVAENNGRFNVTIICKDIPLSLGYLVEEDLIRVYGRENKGTGVLCNMTDGGKGTVGRSQSEDAKRRIGKSHRGVIISEETRAKLRKRKGGVYNKGRKHSFDHIRKAKIAKVVKRGWVIEQVCTISGTVVDRFLFTRDAFYQTGTNVDSISSVINNGRKKTAGGFFWRRCFDLSDIESLIIKSNEIAIKNSCPIAM